MSAFLQFERAGPICEARADGEDLRRITAAAMTNGLSPRGVRQTGRRRTGQWRRPE
jgi:hypothetical protein